MSIEIYLALAFVISLLAATAFGFPFLGIAAAVIIAVVYLALWLVGRVLSNTDDPYD